MTLHQESATVLCQQGQTAAVFLETTWKLVLSLIIRVWLAQCHPEPPYWGGWLTQNTRSMLCQHLHKIRHCSAHCGACLPRDQSIHQLEAQELTALSHISDQLMWFFNLGTHTAKYVQHCSVSESEPTRAYVVDSHHVV